MPKDFQTEMRLDYPRAKLMGNDSVTLMGLLMDSLMGSRTAKLKG